MNWSTLFTMQEKLDEHIVENHHLHHENLLEEKYLALLVELGELANETRCFKFWSTKQANAREKILEEYVDGIHFILSLGIDKGYRFNETLENFTTSIKTSLTEHFNDVFQAIINFRKDASKQNYEYLFINFLQLGQMLQFATEDIFRAYIDKNEVDFARQEEGY